MRDSYLKDVPKEAVEMGDSLSRFVNSYSNKVADLVKVLSCDHRTLQQSVTKFCVAWLEHCAKKHDEGNFDLRNEASCQLGKAFVARIKPEERALPLI